MTAGIKRVNQVTSEHEHIATPVPFQETLRDDSTVPHTSSDSSKLQRKAATLKQQTRITRSNRTSNQIPPCRPRASSRRSRSAMTPIFPYKSSATCGARVLGPSVVRTDPARTLAPTTPDWCLRHLHCCESNSLGAHAFGGECESFSRHDLQAKAGHHTGSRGKR